MLNVYNVTPNGIQSDVELWASRFNLTFQLSPSDPDQVNGAIEYKKIVYQNGQLYDGPDVLALSPVAMHPGWVRATNNTLIPCGSGDPNICLDSVYWWVDVEANDSTGSLSCRLNITGAQLRRVALPSPTPRGHAQCGETFVNGTTGLTALVSSIGAGTEANPNTEVELTWLTSLSDPLNTTTGNYSYWWIETLSAQPLGSLDCFCAIDTTDANDASGRRFHQFQLSATPQLATYWILVEDPFTRQWSNLSCSVAVSTDRFFASNTCGSFGDSTGDVPTGTPQFPLLNVTAWTIATGFSTAGALWFLSGALILALGLGGYMVAGPIGGAAASILSIPLVVLLNLVAEWWIVLAFFLAATALVLAFTRRGD